MLAASTKFAATEKATVSAEATRMRIALIYHAADPLPTSALVMWKGGELPTCGVSSRDGRLIRDPNIFV